MANETTTTNNPLFEAKLADAGILKNALEAVCELVKDEVSFQLSSDGMSMNAMDPANVSMVVFRLLRPAFDEYKVEGEGQTMGVDLEKFYQVLKQANPGDSVTLSSDGKKMKIAFSGPAGRRTFHLSLVEMQTEGKKVPTLTFDASIVLPTGVFSQGVSDAAVLGDSIVFSTDGESFTMSASGDSKGDAVESRLAKGDESLKDMKVSAPSRARYAIDYLKKMIKGAKLADTVRLQFKSDFPMQLDYTKLDTLQLQYILAPRIENE